MLDLKDYKPKEQFFWLRLTRRCCIVRMQTGRTVESSIILANVWCMVDGWEGRLTITDVNVLPAAMQRMNVYFPRRWVHKETKEEIMIPIGFEFGSDSDTLPVHGPSSGDYVLVTGIPQLLIVEAVNVPLMLGSHFELLCVTQPGLGLVRIPDTADPWYGLLKPDAINDMLPYVYEILPYLEPPIG